MRWNGASLWLELLHVLALETVDTARHWLRCLRAEYHLREQYSNLVREKTADPTKMEAN